jgi:hypothetical protein
MRAVVPARLFTIKWGREAPKTAELEITSWLRGLGLQQYDDAFRQNAIDGEVLLDLTAEDLRDLGVTLIGHRRKLLAAIAGLRVERAGSTVPIAPGGSPLPNPPPLAGEGREGARRLFLQPRHRPHLARRRGLG